MKFYSVFLTFLFFQSISIQNANSQNAQLNALTDKLEKLTTSFPQEKVFLHTDRKFYVPGDPIWFQAYITAYEANLPSVLSTNLRVELFSKDKELIVEQLVFAQTGYGEGVIDLPRDLKGGSYILRSYTNYMRNFDADFFFEKEIVVVSDSVEVETSSDIPQNLGEIDVQFFPEGGHLVSGLPARVAFKAIDNTGHSIDVKGELFYRSGKRINAIESEHDGMGAFNLVPQFGEDYFVRIEGSEQVFSLPEVEQKGYSLYAFPEAEGKIKLRITTNKELAKSEKHFLVIHSNGELYYDFELNLSDKLAIAMIPTDVIPEGIAHITLFDDSANPLLERLVFIKKPLDNELSVSTNKQEYTLREKVGLKIKAIDSLGNPQSGIFSLSVIDLGQALDYAPEQSIYSELLLTSDLKGYIDNPMYYFSSKNENALPHLDLVMLTHGWSRFSWEDLKKDVLPSLDYFVEQGLTVSGTLYKFGSDKTISGGEVTFINNQATPPIIASATTSDKGKFIFEEAVVYDDETIFFRGQRDKKRDNVRFEIDSIKYDWPSFSQNILLKGDKIDPTSNLSFLAKNERRDLIEKAYGLDTGVTYLDSFAVEASREDGKREALQKTAYGKGSDAYSFVDSPSATSYTDVFSALVGKFTGVTISPTGFGAPQISIRQNSSIEQSFPPMILLDDVEVQMESAMSLDPNSISRVVLFKGLAASGLFGSAGRGGVLAFYTKSSDGLEVETKKWDENFLSTTLQGAYSSSRKFYSPKYDVKSDLDIKYDQRLVLFWKPLIELDEHGEATIEFWNSDEETSILIDLQGLMSDGKPFQFTKTYETKKN
tara:strand:+ start:42112 stop:44586 length:2475 start_codon:yes stop_codon:yes gene_type:complete